MKTLFTTAAHRYTQHQGKKDILQFMNTKSTAKEKCSDQSARRMEVPVRSSGSEAHLDFLCSDDYEYDIINIKSKRY